MTTKHDRPVLIAYDGSDAARYALERAAELFPGGRALVVTAWRPVGDAAGAARAALPQALIDEAVRKLDEAAESVARQTAQQGADVARAAGLSPSALATRADESVWACIVRAAEEHSALAVVVGSRGRSALRSAVLGSVSNGVVHHCRRPVVVVHPNHDGNV